MKQEALKALLAMAHKRMAEEDAESPVEAKMEELMGEEKAPAEGEMEAESPSGIEDVLSFLKSRSVPEPTSKMAAVVSVKPKAKGSHLFKKK